MNENLVLDFKDLSNNAKQQLIKLLALYLRMVGDNERVEIKMRVQLKENNSCTKAIKLNDPIIWDILEDKFTTLSWDSSKKQTFEYSKVDEIALIVKAEYAL
jgi:hypothetical protein